MPEPRSRFILLMMFRHFILKVKLIGGRRRGAERGIQRTQSLRLDTFAQIIMGMKHLNVA